MPSKSYAGSIVLAGLAVDFRRGHCPYALSMKPSGQRRLTAFVFALKAARGSLDGGCQPCTLSPSVPLRQNGVIE